ncbi:Xanthine and CO dehydrogenases maturation factor, XdhC/CoxF family [hydrothermal vent metagenome]|uniref:Xanthine and CO dehydrogenases maturation factor, XdhC/CoxF family n=1 Tax=hydrothermal vent metagenome TaxID=652676 RepID=A0A3B1AWC8_9ZZZZ
MQNWAPTAYDMIRKDGWVVLVTICRVQGSIPREVGTKMLVGPDTIKGTIGGGALEHLAIKHARLMAIKRRPLVKHMDVPLGPKTQQCCGGRVELLLEILDESHAPLFTAIEKAEKSYSPTHMVTSLTGDMPIKIIIDGPAISPLDIKDAQLIEPLGDRRMPLYLFGAGHVGKAIAERMRNLPFRVIWADSREAEFPNVMPENVEICLANSTSEIVAGAPAGAIFLVMTYSHQIDYAVTAAILSRGDAAFCGLIGSKTKHVRFLKRFQAEEGLSQKACDLLTCPIGLLSVKGKDPEIIAISVIAQLLEKFG